MDNFTSLHDSGDPPNSPNSDALRFCTDSNNYISVNEIFRGPSNSNDSNTDFLEPPLLEPFFDFTQFDNFPADGQDEGIDENAGDPDTNTDHLLDNNHHILPFDGYNGDHIGEFQYNAEDLLEEVREGGENEIAGDPDRNNDHFLDNNHHILPFEEQGDHTGEYQDNAEDPLEEVREGGEIKNAADPDRNNGHLIGNNLHIMPFDGTNGGHTGEFHHDVEDPVEEVREGRERENSEDENMENCENARPLSIWPPHPVPFSCSSCQVLRDIVHSNRTYVIKLEIHGRVGILCHGVIEVRSNIHENPSVTHSMIDFCWRSLEDVKNYILQYCQEKKAAGFVMADDPLSPFYSALCVDLNRREENVNTSVPNQASEPETEAAHPVFEDNVLPPPQRSLSEQRRRAENLKLSDLVEYFHMTEEAASKRLGLCQTTIKNICRDYGLRRWPYRKIKAIEKEIRNLEKKLGRNNDEPIRAQILQLQQNRDRYLIVSDTTVPAARRRRR